MEHCMEICRECLHTLLVVILRQYSTVQFIGDHVIGGQIGSVSGDHVMLLVDLQPSHQGRQLGQGKGPRFLARWGEFCSNEAAYDKGKEDDHRDEQQQALSQRAADDAAAAAEGLRTDPIDVIARAALTTECPRVVCIAIYFIRHRSYVSAIEKGAEVITRLIH